ncbi:uncharacterized protein LOC133160058 [Syngnathus typhle]|uniref:uncharacterized protein LOC133160058 n=1 Tax=Syngnathus typhle TaxID=161592 RepID=UPI002A6B324D|nr:uncharacterized protein LOC133160058 [Syngnathus typhle]
MCVCARSHRLHSSSEAESISSAGRLHGEEEVKQATLQFKSSSLKSAMERKTNEGSTSTSPQKHMKNRSKSIEETQQSKRGISSQKSLPGRPELDRVKECLEASETPSASTEELKG